MIYSGHCGYLDDIGATVDGCRDVLTGHLDRFDFILCTGMSGALVGSPLSIRVDKPLVVLRKRGEKYHATKDLIHGEAAVGRYLFLDDFISFGETYICVREAMDWRAKYAGTYLYADNVLSWDGDGTIEYDPGDSVSVSRPACNSSVQP